MKTTEQELIEHLDATLGPASINDSEAKRLSAAEAAIHWLCCRLDEMKNEVMAEMIRPPTLGERRGSSLDHYALVWHGIERDPGETDDGLRSRCWATPVKR